ncbi:hypothetical protein BDV95DRAFT_629672 [Massariosphaeria phaeospora]|uniref:Uncharacterized protein n=1 Tax=Massariosphaeria phaeospora TaxID=100035 RepID=A0A7C8I707_9PLEO|nr:hypothetical protein BDV95DRAFT_629672 [Massariosphaeria phaeospora]
MPTASSRVLHRLVASATVAASSAVGLSYGRQRRVQHPNNRKARAARELQPTAMSQTSTLSGLPVPLPAPSRAPPATRLSYDGRPPRRLVRRMTSDDTARQPASMLANGYGNGYGAPLEQAVDPLQVPSRRSSWIKRLSTSQASSRNTSPGPLLSPSLSCSNGSMAFSHDGSTAPIMGRRSPSPMPPNKLVKRSSSVRAPRELYTVQGAAPRLPGLRRPATSHQRSATLQHQTALMEMTVEHPSAVQLPSSTDNDPEYTRFFAARIPKEKTLSKKKGSVANAGNMRRVFPDDKNPPTLLLARSVSEGADEVEDSVSEDGDSIFFVSRPGTPMSITAVIASKPEVPNAREDKRALNGVSTERTDEAERPRRSFSLSDFLSPGSGAKKQRLVRLPGTKLSRKSSQRVSSAPLPVMSKRPSSTAHGESYAASVRRDFTDPALVRREISTSAGLTETSNSRHGHLSGFVSQPLLALPQPRAVATTENTAASMHHDHVPHPASAGSNQIPPSPTLVQAGGRPSRHSVTPSEQASTLVGSDNEARGVGSGDEDDVDIQSETVFDSLRTGATRSTSGARGPRIETIFDESPPAKPKVTALRDLLPKGTFREEPTDSAPGHQSIAEEEESISTPVRTIVPERSFHESPSLGRGQNAPLFPTLIPSSPPDMRKPLSLGRLEWDLRIGEDDNSSRWSLDEQGDGDPWGDFPSRSPVMHAHVATPVSLERHNPRSLASGSSPKPTPTTPQHLISDHADRDARSSIFDWSEQQPTDKSSGNRTPPRPRTVHGKKDADRRGTRSVSRRAPSGLHARSQSVPVVPDAASKRSAVVTNKFGTWGVGSKGVTEDWDDDFDFSEEPAAKGAAVSQRIDSGSAMLVPNTIREQQSNVLANISLLREWGLLIEELKEQKFRAAALGILEGVNSHIWEEVDAMIDLADQEAEHEGITRLSPPSSPGFDEDAFEDVTGPSPSQGRGRRRSGLATDDLSKGPIHPTPQPTQRLRRKSILPPNYEIFGPQSSPIPPKPKFEMTSTSSPKFPVTRPRKDSEAKARSVIEALQKKRSNEPEASSKSTPTTKKVPFDTATLRRIVPYVFTLNHKVKEALKEAEGLYSSPRTSPNGREPEFSKIFQNDNDLATQMKLTTFT